MATTRREFLKNVSLASVGMAIGGVDMIASAADKPAAAGASSPKGGKVKIAYIGIGNRGEQIINDFAKTGMVDVVALCDVDLGAKHTQKVLSMYPNAKRFKDFRKMFDEAGNTFDAVAIATPDFSHFPISMLALSEGKHVYVENLLPEHSTKPSCSCKRPKTAQVRSHKWAIRDIPKQTISSSRHGLKPVSSRM